MNKKRIAIIGSGISGLTAAHFLSSRHDLVLFEAEGRLGGHTATIDVSTSTGTLAVDTGFIVYNDWTYPNFIRLLNRLGVATQPTSMGFSVSCAQSGIEYSGHGLSGLFAQASNLISPAHWGMIQDILKFNRCSIEDVENESFDRNTRLGDYLNQRGFGKRFKDYYLVPMAAAIWSASFAEVENMPLQFFVRFFKNHGLLSVKNRPQWHVISGGSRSYIDPLIQPYRSAIRLNSPVQSVAREDGGAWVISKPEGSEQPVKEKFDEVVFACHSDQALAILQDADQQEQTILGALPYTENEVVLHTDIRLLPKRQSVWSSWNYLLGHKRDQAVLTYDMNILQGLQTEETYCVTLNHTAAIDPDKVIGTYRYAHPQFTPEGVQAQERWGEINGVKNTWFCGAYWRNGFHEDGVFSALDVANGLGCDWATLPEINSSESGVQAA